MWKVPGRIKPVPLNYETIMDGSFVSPPLAKQPASLVGAVSSSATHESSQARSTASAIPPQGKLKDQQELTIKQNLELFLERSVATNDSISTCDFALKYPGQLQKAFNANDCQSRVVYCL
jgi:hypothetical protein